MNAFKQWLYDRLVEQSTWTGIGTIIATMTFIPDSKQIGDLVPTIGLLVVGIIKIVMPENVKS